MNMFLTNNWLILNVLIPLISGMIIILSKDCSKARNIFQISAVSSIFLLLFMPETGTSYYLGGFEAPIGIEYKIDNLNYSIITYLNIILALFAISIPWLKSNLEDGIKESKKHYIYGILLLAQTGYLGIASTLDLFNLFVFIEISSLATYALISCGSGRHAIVASLDYLIVGTVSATFILVGIGMLYSITGTLNMEDAREALRDNFGSKMLISGSLIFCIGTLLKMAIFPLHSWIIKTYRHTSSHILLYTASISVVIGFHIILRFIHTAIGTDIFNLIGMNQIFQILSIIAMISGSYLGNRVSNFREIVLYSSIVQMAYILMMISATDNLSIILKYILADGFMKFILFTYLSQHEKYSIHTSFAYITIFGILSNLGLPITIGFFNKINLFTILLDNMYYGSFIAVSAATVISINYNFKMINHIADNIGEPEFSISHSSGIILASLLSLGLIFYGII